MKLKFISIIALSAIIASCASPPKNTTTSQINQSTTSDSVSAKSTLDAMPKSTPDAMPKTKPTKIAKNMQSVAVSSNPEGASCILELDDEEIGTVKMTPANVVIKRKNFSIKSAKVTCSKEGYVTNTAYLHNNPAENEISGNIGAIFNAVKLIEGSLAAWDDSVFVKLTPAYFTSVTQRDNYLEAETALLNDKFTQSSERYLTCKGKKCAKRLAELQSNYDESLANLKTGVAAIPVK